VGGSPRKRTMGHSEHLQRFAPQTQSLRLVHEVNDDGIDYSKLTEEQLDQLDAILEQAGIQPLAVEGGEGPSKTE
jgi:hypothetical protein